MPSHVVSEISLAYSSVYGQKNARYGGIFISRENVAALCCIALSCIYLNAMFFRISGVNIISYAAIIATSGVLFLSRPALPFALILVAPIIFFANENILMGFIIVVAMRGKFGQLETFRNDRDIYWFLLFSVAIVVFTLATRGIKYDSNLGFVGRIDVGFVHPNLTPVWGMLFAYYARHYLSSPWRNISLAIFAVTVIFSGSLGKVPLLIYFLLGNWPFKFRRTTFYTAIILIVSTSIFLLNSTDAIYTAIVSGRNIIYQGLLDVMGWYSLIFSASQDELVQLATLRSFFGDDFETAMPFDNIVSATTAMGIIPTVLFGLAAGRFKAPRDRKTFDRLMIFWIFGFASNPLSIWTPIFMFALKRSSVKNDQSGS